MAEAQTLAAPASLGWVAPGFAPAPLRQAAVLSVAAALPEGRLTTTELAAQLGVSAEWIVSRTGIRERRRAQPHERLADFAARAGERALAGAGVSAERLDLVLVATMTPDELTPNTAPLVAQALGAGRAGAIDIGAACTGFLSALALGAAQLEAGRAEHALVIGADFVTRITDYGDKRTAPLFADAAGAVVLGPARRHATPGTGGAPPGARLARSCSAPTVRTAPRSWPPTTNASCGWTAPRYSATPWPG